MALKLPVSLRCEFRGLAVETEFVSRDTGQVVTVPAKLKCEYETDSGDVDMLTLSTKQFDEAQGAPDYKRLTRGQRMTLYGFAVIQDRGSDRASYFRLERVELDSDAGKAPSGKAMTAAA